MEGGPVTTFGLIAHPNKLFDLLFQLKRMGGSIFRSRMKLERGGKSHHVKVVSPLRFFPGWIFANHVQSIATADSPNHSGLGPQGPNK
jgi:hypothetical protein